jgi:hypothetical protein
MVRCSVILEGCSDGYPQVNSINPSITSTTNMSLTSLLSTRGPYHERLLLYLLKDTTPHTTIRHGDSCLSKCHPRKQQHTIHG